MADAAKEHLINHLRDAHALEMQSIRQLERACELCEDSEIQGGYKEHLEQTQEHENQIKERIESYDLKPSAVKDLTMRAGAIGLRQLADVPPDTPVKLAMHFYALEHLEIANYELLGRIAKEAGDNETAEVAEKILKEECEAAEKVKETFDRAAELLLEQEPSADEDEDSDEEESDRKESDRKESDQGSGEGDSGKRDGSEQEEKVAAES